MSIRFTCQRCNKVMSIQPIIAKAYGGRSLCMECRVEEGQRPNTPVERGALFAEKMDDIAVLIPLLNFFKQQDRNTLTNQELEETLQYLDGKGKELSRLLRQVGCEMVIGETWLSDLLRQIREQIEALTSLSV